MHHADAGGDGVARRADRHRPPVDEDLAAVGLVEAVEDAHQRRLAGAVLADDAVDGRSEEHTSELQSLMSISYAGFCLKKKKSQKIYSNNKVIITNNIPLTTHIQ